MATIKAFNDRLQKLDASKTAIEVFMSLSAEVIELNIEQMQYGIDSKGNRIGRYASDSYAKRKNKMSPLAGYGNVDLKYSGDFYNELTLNEKGDGTEYTIISMVEYEQALYEKYGEFMYGLSPVSRAIFIKESYLEAYKNAIQKQIY